MVNSKTSKKEVNKMKSADITHIEDFRESYMQITPKLTVAINDAVQCVAEKVGSDFFVSAICDRRNELVKIAA
jgi:hypothetical protein